MRWNVKPKPYMGQMEVVERFAWFPKRVNHGTAKVWLEKYMVTRQFREGIRYDFWFYSNPRTIEADQ